MIFVTMLQTRDLITYRILYIAYRMEHNVTKSKCHDITDIYNNYKFRIRRIKKYTMEKYAHTIYITPFSIIIIILKMFI